MLGGELTDELWESLKDYTLEQVNSMLGGNDIRTLLFKDAEYTIPAVYSIDYSFTVKNKEASMFIPCSGFYDGISVSGNNPDTWTSTLHNSNTEYAYILNEDSSIHYCDRYCGIPIRPVYNPS